MPSKYNSTGIRAKKEKPPAAAPLKPYASYGICRVEQPHKHSFGWVLRIPGHHEWFTDKKCGGAKKAHIQALARRDELFPNLTAKQQLRGSVKLKRKAQ